MNKPRLIAGIVLTSGVWVLKFALTIGHPDIWTRRENRAEDNCTRSKIPRTHLTANTKNRRAKKTRRHFIADYNYADEKIPR
jgi:hypothetical protein